MAKGSFELHAAKLADKAGAGGRDFQFGQRGLRLCTLAQKTAGSTVHGQHTADGLGRAAQWQVSVWVIVSAGIQMER